MPKNKPVDEEEVREIKRLCRYYDVEEVAFVFLFFCKFPESVVLFPNSNFSIFKISDQVEVSAVHPKMEGCHKDAKKGFSFSRVFQLHLFCGVR